MYIFFSITGIIPQRIYVPNERSILLSIGITAKKLQVVKKVLGKFNKGDHVKIVDKNNEECARGLSSFSSDEINKIKGHHSSNIQELLGYIAKSEVVHKNDMVEI